MIVVRVLHHYSWCSIRIANATGCDVFTVFFAQKEMPMGNNESVGKSSTQTGWHTDPPLPRTRDDLAERREGREHGQSIVRKDDKGFAFVRNSGITR